MMKKLFLLHIIILLTSNLYAVETIMNGIHYFIPDISKNECWIIKDTQDNGFITSSNYSGMIIIPEEIEYDNKKFTVTRIYDYAFYNCSATFISLPKTIKKIGQGAFRSATLLERLNLPDSLQIISKYCLSDCTNLKKLFIPNSVRGIEEGAFQYSAFDSINLPATIQYIGDYAFADSKNIEKINIPIELNSFGNAVFRNCPKLKNIEVPENHSLLTINENMLISNDSTKIYFCPTYVKGEIKINQITKSIENSAFYGCSGITKVDFNEGLNSIHNLSFYGCNQIKELILPSGLKYIGEQAFAECSSVVNIILPNTIEELGFGCFYNTKISSINIPGSVKVLNDKVFYTCNNLFSASIRCVNPPIRTSYLFPLRRQMDIHVLKGLKHVYESAEHWNVNTNIYDDLEWVYVSDIIIDQDEYACNLNEIIQASAKVYPEDADAPSPIWSSEDETIVYIDKEGKFIGLKEGTTNIIATANDGSGISSKAKVHVGKTAKIDNIIHSDKTISEVARYDMLGRPLSYPAKGINIIVLSNGHSIKEFIK